MKSRRVPDIPNEVGLDPVTGQILKGKQLYTTPPQVDANGMLPLVEWAQLLLLALHRCLYSGTANNGLRNRLLQNRNFMHWLRDVL
jgi:hypothetical protein